MSRMKARQTSAFLLALLALCPSVHADATFQNGRIDAVTYAGDEIYIRLDGGNPTNCTGSPFGWMRIPSTSKAMIALVTGLYLRGDLASVNVTVYTSGLDSSGYCTV